MFFGARRYEACGTELSVSDTNSLVREGCVSRAFPKGVILLMHPKEHTISAALKEETCSYHCLLARNGNATFELL